jgi:hypothetical protein
MIRPFLIMVCLLLARADAQTTQETATAEEFATFGVRVTVPPEWKRLPEDGPESIAKWAVVGTGTAETPDVIIIARLESARGQTARTYTSEIARKSDAQAVAEPVGLADEQTWRVNFMKPMAAPAGEGQLAPPQPKTLLAAVHGEYLYAVWGFEGKAGADVDGAMAELLRNWSFVDLQRPSSTTALRAEPVRMLDKLTIRPAVTLRPKEAREKTRGKAVELQIFNWRSGRADMVMTVEVDRRPPKLNLEALGNSLLKQMSLKQDPEKPVKWKKLEGSTERLISTPFEGAKSGSRMVPIRFGLIELSGDQVVLLGFVFPTSDPTDLEIYETLTEAMTSTVEGLKK